MPDVTATVNDLKGLPDQALQSELMNPSGAAPAYLVLAEAQRRQLMRQSAVTEQNKAPIGSVYDDVIRSMMARQPPPGAAPAGATPPPSAPPAAPQTPQNFRPPTGMAEGGEVDDDDDDEEEDDDDTSPRRTFQSPEDWRATLNDSLQAPEDYAGAGPANARMDPQLAALLAGGSPTPSKPASTDPYDPANLKATRDMYSDLYYKQQPPLTKDQQDLRNHIQQMWDQAEKNKKPNFWQYLTNFGLGMASAPGRGWSSALAGGATGMANGVAAQQEAARKQELELMGVSSKLDDQMRAEQGKIGDATAAQARIQQQAIDQAARAKALADAQAEKQLQQEQAAAKRNAFNHALAFPMSVVGSHDAPPTREYQQFVADPDDPTRGVWVPPTQMQVTPEVLNYVPKDSNGRPVAMVTPDQMQAYQTLARKVQQYNAEQANKTQAPNAESQKILYQTALAKVEHERRLAGLPSVNASDLKSVLDAFRASKTLTSDEAEKAIGFAQANATPASQGTAATIRFEGIEKSRPISVVDTQTGQVLTTNMMDFNQLQAGQPGRYVQSSIAMPVMSKEATYGDILYNISHTRQAVQQLGSMDASQRAELAMALQSTDPKEAVHTFLTGAVGTTMTDQQKEAVIAIRQLMENALMLRQLGAMGQGSDELRRAITDTLPGAKSPDTTYMLRQLDQFYQTVQRLHKGLPALGKPGAGNPPGAANKKKPSLDEIFVK